MLRPIHKIEALLAGITKADAEQVPPAHRQRLAQALRYTANLIDPPDATPKVGVLARLRDGERAENCTSPKDTGKG